MLEQAARVEAARLSLVKPLLETNKICATKDLDDDELDDLVELSRSVLVRSEYLEPFQEQLPLSHTLMSQVRVSPSRSVGSVSPTNDFSLTPSLVETTLDKADSNICDVLFEEEIIPAPPSEVTRPPAPIFDSTDLLVVEENFPKTVSAADDVEMVVCTPSLMQVDLDKADINVCDVVFEEEIIPARPSEVTRPPAPIFDSTDLLVVEDNFAETVSAVDHVEMLVSAPSLMQIDLDKADVTVCDVVFEEEIIPARPSEVTRPPAPVFDSTDLLVVEDNFAEAVSAKEDVEAWSISPTDMTQELYKAVETDVELRECEEEMIVAEQMTVVERAPVNWPDERTASPFIVDECFMEPDGVETAVLTASDVDHDVVLEKVDVVEEDIYFVEEEHFIVEAAVDVQQLMKSTEQMYSEERCVSPFVNENVKLKPIHRDADCLTLALDDRVTEPLNHAKVDECDLYYYEEESFSVDVVCDFMQLLQRSTSPFSVEEHVLSETVHAELSAPETTARPSEIRPISDVDIAAKNSSSETFVLPQVVVHRVEATSRLSPLPAAITATSSADSTALSSASVDECTICSHDEETFSQSTLEQTTTFEQRLETFQDQEGSFDQPLEAQDEEIFSEVIVEQKTEFESEAEQRLEVPDDDVEMYSSGEETYDRWTVETYKVYLETRTVDADLTFRRSQPLATAVHSSHGMSLQPISSLYLFSSMIRTRKLQDVFL